MPQALRRFVFVLFIVVPLFSFGDVLKMTVAATIQPITEEFIDRGIQHAAATQASALLIELRTPGGLESSTREIITKITSSPVPVIVYVYPSGSRAASAGFFILESADIAAMAPGTNTGAAHPVTLGFGQPDAVMKEKITNDSAALMRSVAARRARNVQIAESAVRESKSFTDQEALKDHLIDIVARNPEELLSELNGRTITRWDGQKVTLNTSGPIREYHMTLKERILGWMMDPNVSFVILAIGLLGLYIEFNHPGAIIPGVVGFFFIVLAIFALNILPVRYSALGLILLSFVFFALEAKFTSHGALALAGIASLTIGALLLVDSPIPQMQVHLWTALSVSIPLGLITVFLMTIAIRARRNKVTTGIEGLVGEIGTAQTPLTPEGQVFVHGEIWNAISSQTVNVGEQIRVQKVDGLRLVVEPVTIRARAR